MHLGKWHTASANLMNFLGWQFSFSADVFLLNNWQCSLGPFTQKEGKYPQGSFFPTKYSPASMSVFHQSPTNVHTQNTRQHFKHLTQSGKVQSLMNLGSWFKENGRNVHRPSVCKEFQSVHVCWHNLWIVLSHPVRAWLGTYLCLGYTTACRHRWCIAVSWCQIKICHCLTVKINRFQYYTKAITVLIYST